MSKSRALLIAAMVSSLASKQLLQVMGSHKRTIGSNNDDDDGYDDDDDDDDDWALGRK